ncbi:MAG TPA: hypothetical protein VN924_07760 [Bryobacteraceae bacterium]|nr:hypothetical protein [Bryobacteraceae bacterium]
MFDLSVEVPLLGMPPSLGPHHGIHWLEGQGSAERAFGGYRATP